MAEHEYYFYVQHSNLSSISKEKGQTKQAIEKDERADLGEVHCATVCG